MPYKQWVVGEEVLAADFNTFVQKQVIAVFANAASRTSGLTSPTEGQLTFLQDTDRYDFWDGTAWKPLYGVGPPIGGGQTALAGTYTGQPVQMRGWKQTMGASNGNYSSALPAAVNGVLSAHAQVVTQFNYTTNVTGATTSAISGIIFATTSGAPYTGSMDVAFMALVW